MKTSLTVQDILTERIHLPPEFERDAIREDDQLLTSIKASGVQQPLVVVESEGVYKVIKGGRRLRIAKSLGIPKLPCVILSVPESKAEMTFMREERFRIDQHRQDLLPSQRAQLIQEFQRVHNFTNGQVAAYLGVVRDTISNWKLDAYDPSIVEAIDAGRTTAAAVRPLRAMTKEGQKQVFLKYADSFADPRGTKKLVDFLWRTYTPEKHPDLFPDAQRAANRRGKQPVKKTRRVTKNYSHDEKRKLVGSLEMQEEEVEANKLEIRNLKEWNTACIPVVSAILRNRSLRAMVPAETLEELEEWAKRYVE